VLILHGRKNIETSNQILVKLLENNPKYEFFQLKPKNETLEELETLLNNF